MKRVFIFISVLLIGFGILLCAKQNNQIETPLNEIPMYGNLSKTPKEIEIDNKFIEDVVKQFGSKEAAAKNGLKLAWYYYYQKKDPKTAMKRFNQAWLLDSNNPEIFWGFGVIMGARSFEEAPEKNLNESIKFLEKASETLKDNPRLMIDLAYSETNLGAFLKLNQKKGFEEHFNKAAALFKRSETLKKDDPLLYSNWAVLEFFEENYTAAKEKLDTAKNLGFKPTPSFENDLEKRLKEAHK